jgi:uncharacterized UBP type Zn finger protein
MRGIYNYGNTCYFNAAIQALAHCPQLSMLFYNDINYNCEITNEYKKILKELFKDETSPVNPRGLLHAFKNKFPEFNNLNQHDSAEVIFKLIDVFEKSVGKELITDIFNCEIIQETKWIDNVKKNSILKSSYTIIDLYVDDNSDLYNLIKKNNAQSEILDYKDDYGRIFNAVKTNSFSKFGKIISFSFSMYEEKYKISIPMKFEGRTLFSCIIHNGVANSGHYGILVKNVNWYIIDDCSVSEIKLDESEISGSFYMAFYR